MCVCVCLKLAFDMSVHQTKLWNNLSLSGQGEVYKLWYGTFVYVAQIPSFSH